MAFDQPLEADRVDDLNLFTTLIRAPVVGALFWFLGGEEAKQKNEEEKRFREQLFLGDSSESTTPVDHVPADSLSSSHSFVDNCRKSSMKKAAPSMAESDVSHDDYVVERCQESLDRMNLQECPNHTLKRKKELSWSEHLVEYAGEVRLRIVIVRYVWLSVQVIAFVLVRALGCCCFVARSGLALECDERLRLMSVLFGGSAVSIQAEIRPFSRPTLLGCPSETQPRPMVARWLQRISRRQWNVAVVSSLNGPVCLFALWVFVLPNLCPASELLCGWGEFSVVGRALRRAVDTHGITRHPLRPVTTSGNGWKNRSAITQFFSMLGEKHRPVSPITLRTQLARSCCCVKGCSDPQRTCSEAAAPVCLGVRN